MTLCNRLAVRTLLVASMAVGQPSWSCSGPGQPGLDIAYAGIHLAQVVGVKLTDYADNRLAQLRGGTPMWAYGPTQSYEVDVLPIETFKGAGAERLTLTIPRACLPVPELMQYGLFYVNEAGVAMPVYQDDAGYRDRLLKLGSHFAEVCKPAEVTQPHPCWKPRTALMECIDRVRNLAAYQPDAATCPIEVFDRLNTQIMGRFNWRYPPMQVVKELPAVP